MQYDDLTAEQKTALDAWLQIMRPLSGQIQRTVAGSVPIDDDWNASVSAIVALLDPGALVPNNSGLPASPVTKEDIEASAVTLSDLLAQLNTAAVRQRAIRMAGLVNVAGG
ncbi:MAG: hypothetical protein ACPHF4_08780 [Rubripirellula sp.]